MSDTDDQPFNPDVNNYEPETKPIEHVIIAAIDAALLNVHTWRPAQVTQVNGDRTVNLQLLLKKLDVGDAQAQPISQIQNCLVWCLRGANWSSDAPVAKDDTGIALFCERSLDVWQPNGGLVDPADPRHHDITDAIFLPGCYSVAEALSGDGKDWIFTNGDGTHSSVVTLKQDGTVVVSNDSQQSLTVGTDGSYTLDVNGQQLVIKQQGVAWTITAGTAAITLDSSGLFKFQGTSELMNLIATLVQDLMSAMVMTALGPQPFLPSTIALLTTLLAQLEAMTAP